MLWILTQDDKSIMNVKEVSIDGKKIEGVIGSASLDHWSKVVGKYDTKERANEVLQDMFAKLAEHKNNVITYEMPKN